MPSLWVTTIGHGPPSVYPLSTWRHQHDISQAFPSVFAHCKWLKTGGREGLGMRQYTYCIRHLLRLPPTNKCKLLVRNGSNLPSKTNITLVESFKSSCHGNTFWLTESTWKTRKESQARLSYIRIVIKIATHTNVAITKATYTVNKFYVKAIPVGGIRIIKATSRTKIHTPTSRKGSKNPPT